MCNGLCFDANHYHSVLHAGNQAIKMAQLFSPSTPSLCMIRDPLIHMKWCAYFHAYFVNCEFGGCEHYLYSDVNHDKKNDAF